MLFVTLAACSVLLTKPSVLLALFCPLLMCGCQVVLVVNPWYELAPHEVIMDRYVPIGRNIQYGTL